jgi:4-amino-4-deoxy-L-arabinose transferase-like glycosyltransferase
MGGIVMSKEILKYALAIAGVILGWVMIVPAFEFPDEQAHLGSVSYLLDNGSMPVYEKQDLTQEMVETQKLLGVFRDGLGNNKYTYHPEYHVEYSDSVTGIYESEIQSLNNHESRSTYVGSEAAKYPPLYYRFTSIYMWLVDGSDIFTRLFVSRLSGIDIAFVMAIVVWKIGYLIFKKKVYANTLALLVMTQPMMSFVTAGVNSDNLHNLWFTLIIYLCLKLIQSGLKMKEIISIGIVIALDIYTKPQGFITLPIIALAISIGIFRFREWKMLGWIACIGAVALLLSGSQWEVYKGLFSVGNTHGSTFIEYLRFSANKLVAQNVVWYWGVFKWLGVVLPPIYWRIANRVVLLSVIGLVIYTWKVFKKKKIVADPYSIIFVMCASIIYALVIFWYDWQHTKINGYSLGIQARYFFPTIVVHMAILMTGIISLGWNAVSRKWLRRVIIMLFLWLQIGGIWHIITIYYPGQSLSELIIQASQYKPIFAKGIWWYLWGAIYLWSLYYLVKNSLLSGNQASQRHHQK